MPETGEQTHQTPLTRQEEALTLVTESPLTWSDPMLVKDAMTRRAETIGPDETLQTAARKMREAGVGALAVCEQDEMIGMLTDRDIVVRSTAAGADPCRSEVRSAMTAQMISCSEDDDLGTAARVMEERAVRRVAVVDASKRLVGLLSVDDLAVFSRSIAGDIITRSRAPEVPLQRHPWSWWSEDAGDGG